MKLTDRINHAVHPWMIKYVSRYYNKKMAWCAKRHPELFKPVDGGVTAKHLALWGKLGLPCSDKWLRFLSNISGVVDYRYLPEDILYARVERILNDCERRCRDAEDKNQFDIFVDPALQPRTVLRYVRGMFYDADHHYVSEAAAKDILSKNQGRLIGKVCVNSLGGFGISAFQYEKGGYVSNRREPLTLDWITKQSVSYLIQECIQQCDFSAKFNPSSANTCKLVTLRCPWSGKIDVVRAGMRFGVTKDVFDNLSSGGISVAINPKTGLLSSTAHNWYKADPFKEHPSTHVAFGGQVHPFYETMRDYAIKFAERVPNMHMLSWDMIANDKNEVKILEVNAASQSSDWLQFDFGGFYGEYTEDLVEWCASHLHFDQFAHIRTWY